MSEKEPSGTSRYGVAAAAMMLVAAQDLPAPMPALNIQLSFVCLSISDNRLGAIEAHSMNRLPQTAPESSLAVTTSRQSGTAVAISSVRDARGNTLHVEEIVGGADLCADVPNDSFQLARVGEAYEARLCITPPNPNFRANVRVTMRLTGRQGGIDEFSNRILAIASCLPPNGVDILNSGVVVGREIIRTTGGN